MKENYRMMTILAAVVIAIGAMMLSGCKAFYENSGSHTVVGSLTAPVEVTEPTSSCNIKALYTMDGADVWTSRDSIVRIKYANVFTNNYFYIVKTHGKQDLEVEIEPLDTGSGNVADGAATAEPEGTERDGK